MVSTCCHRRRRRCFLLFISDEWNINGEKHIDGPADQVMSDVQTIHDRHDTITTTDPTLNDNQDDGDNNYNNNNREKKEGKRGSPMLNEDSPANK